MNSSRLAIFLRSTVLLSAVAAAGPAVAQLRITEPLPQQPASTGTSARSLSARSLSARPVSARIRGQTQRRASAAQNQLYAKVRFLYMDQATHAAMYRAVSRASIRRATLPSSRQDSELNFHDREPRVQRQITESAVPVVCVLSADDRAAIDDLVTGSSSSESVSHPAVHFSEGNTTSVNDMTERPFATIDQGLKMVNEGTLIRMRAAQQDESRIHFACEVRVSRLVRIEPDPVAANESIVSPTVETVSVVATESVPRGHTLLVDPMMTQQRTIDAPAPRQRFLERIPWFAATRNQSVTKTVDQSLVVLIEPVRSD